MKIQEKKTMKAKLAQELLFKKTGGCSDPNEEGDKMKY